MVDNDEPFPHPCGFDEILSVPLWEKASLFFQLIYISDSEMGYKNWRRDISGKRFVMLHRANYAGQQAHSTMQWSNDIQSYFDVL